MSDKLKDDDDFLIFNDGLENLVSGLGTSMDKSTHNEWKLSGRNQDWTQIMARYREDWVAQKVCNVVPQDMTREWRTIDSEEGMKADKSGVAEYLAKNEGKL